MIIEFNVLLSSAGHRVERVQIFKQVLREMGLSGRVLASDVSRLAAVFQAADGAIITPPSRDAEFVPTLVEACRANRVNLVVPSIDPALPIYAANKQAFAEVGATMLISSLETVEICGDKRNTHRWLNEHGFPTPRQTTVEEALASPSAWPYPLFVKPACGSASVGAHVVRNADELRILTQDDDYVVETVARGDEYTVDALVNRQGRCVCAVPRRRIAVRAGEIFKGITVRNELIQQTARDISERLPGAHGPLNIQLFYEEETQEIQVTEINPRFSGGFPLTWQAGADFPRWIIEEIMDRPSTASDDWQDGLIMLRYFEALYLDSLSAWG